MQLAFKLSDANGFARYVTVCDTVPMSAWGRVLYSNTLGVLPALLLGAAFREYGALKGYNWTAHALDTLGLSCVCGISMSYTSFLLRARISATAFTVIGILCKVGTVLVNVLIWDQHASRGALAALLVCLAAGSMYTPAPLRQPAKVVARLAVAATPVGRPACDAPAPMRHTAGEVRSSALEGSSQQSSC